MTSIKLSFSLKYVYRWASEAIIPLSNYLINSPVLTYSHRFDFREVILRPYHKPKYLHDAHVLALYEIVQFGSSNRWSVYKNAFDQSQGLSWDANVIVHRQLCQRPEQVDPQDMLSKLLW